VLHQVPKKTQKHTRKRKEQNKMKEKKTEALIVSQRQSVSLFFHSFDGGDPLQ